MAVSIGSGWSVGPGWALGTGTGGGGGGDITGSLTIGFNSDFGPRYGRQTGFLTYGSVTDTPTGIVAALYTTVTTFTVITFNGGTYGSITVDGMSGLIDGVTSLSVTIGGTTATLSTGGPSAGGYSIASDPFNLQGQNGTTVSFSITLL